ncbi:PKD domain-containing protein [Nocardioides aequoreus]|uniref:PKD domain-containing protein n=1 Tax=Nocardioides aequoreus TaxID=397278 RepID=UPI001FE1D4EF|nr:PKD domain-containing protein [Nocardioides aequoreus]
MLVLTPEVARAANSAQGRLVADQPANGTPHVLDGRVNSIAKIGNSIVLGGSFAQTRNDASTTQIPRSNLVAFDETSGQISTTFLPNPNGEITTVLPTGDGSTVFVAGAFSSIGGVARSNLARIRVSDGAVVQTFNAGSITGRVRDLRLAGGRLWIAGSFTHVGGRAQRSLATVNPTTGAFDTYMSRVISGVHNGGTTGVVKIDVNPQGDRLLAIGNFDALDGVAARQLFMLDISGTSAQASSFSTNFYVPTCRAQSFDSYMRDLDFSPDGRFFVITTTGAYGGSTGPCDTSARFETYASGADVQPSWVDYTGGDTTYAVEITDSAVYTGGHARWQNNPFAGDTPGQGAVDRPGIAALDPLNGLPLSWNPTRSRGVGVFDFLVTSRGLWVGSDTERIGANRYKGRIALLPLAGTVIPANTTPTLPNDAYAFGGFGAESDPRFLYRVNAGGPSLPASGGIDWAADLAGAPSPQHNGVGNRATYAPVPTVDGTVPASTPRALFESELWDPASAPEQAWDFAVPAGTPLEVRLYFSNRCTCTQSAGQRQFDVDVDGVRVLDDFDISAAVGHNVGTMRSFDITSDGNVDIDLLHVTENPLINGIEILRTDLPPNTTSPIAKYTHDGATFGARTPVEAGGIDWNAVRGAFMLRGQLYLAHGDGTFDRRSFNGTEYGAPVAVDTSDQLTVLQNWRSDIARVTGMFFDSGRIYYTMTGSNQLYYRYFTPESDVVGAKQLVVGGNVAGIDFAQVRGMFTTGDHLYWAKPDGSLNRLDWAEGDQSDRPVGGTATQVSGTTIDGYNWSSRGLFLFQNPNGEAAGQPPVADIAYSCAGLTCQFNSSGSTSPGTTITQRTWDFGDGNTSAASNPSHTYASSGTRTVTLTIRTADGRQATTTREVSVQRVNGQPVAAFDASCDQLDCDFDASGSSDPDGDDLTYSWNFGDSATGAGETTQHSYATAGTRTVTLTVSDGQLQSQATRQVAVSETTNPGISFVDAATTSGNRSTHSVQIPAGVQAGDQLLLFITTNSSTTTVATPAGWTQVETRQGNGIRGVVWGRTATAGLAGSTVSVTSSALTKSTLTVAGYRSQSGAATISASAVGGTDSPATSHTAPAVPVADAGSWVATYWSEKSSEDVTWSAAGSTSRTTGSGSGSGKTSALLADTNSGVTSGNRPGATATTSASVGRSVHFSLVIAPA